MAGEEGDLEGHGGGRQLVHGHGLQILLAHHLPVELLREVVHVVDKELLPASKGRLERGDQELRKMIQEERYLSICTGLPIMKSSGAK